LCLGKRMIRDFSTFPPPPQIHRLLPGVHCAKHVPLPLDVHLDFKFLAGCDAYSGESKASYHDTRASR